MALLEVERLTKEFDGIKAVEELSLQIKPGTIVSLIGPNGAGKTTLFNVISGFYQPELGKIYYSNMEITGLSPLAIARLGITRTFQNIRLFRQISVLDNVLLGMGDGRNETLCSALLLRRHVKKKEKRNRERALQLLKAVDLIDKSEQLAENLSYGQQRMLEITRALATNSELFLFDEPTAGLSSSMVERIIGIIRGLQEEGKTVFLVSHDMRVVTDISTVVIVLNCGKKIAEGNSQEITKNKEVIEAYLGKPKAIKSITDDSKRIDG